MTRRVVSYHDVVEATSEAGPSNATMDLSDDGDDEVAPLPSGVHRPARGGEASTTASTSGKLTMSAKKRMKKKRKIEREQRQRANESIVGANGNAGPGPSTSASASTGAKTLFNDNIRNAQYVADNDADYTQYEEAAEGDEDSYYDEDNGDDYDEGYDDEAGFELHTNLMIPEIPAHMRPASSCSRHPRLGNGDIVEEADATPDVLDPTGRILADDDICADTALVDAWSAACATLCPSQKPKPAPLSSLWNHAPLAGSANHKKMKVIAQQNREKRRLRRFVEEQNSGGKASATNPPQALPALTQSQQQSTKPQPAIATPDPSIPATVKLNRAIPPSIGLQGNAAWQAACATVASTKNRIGPSIICDRTVATTVAATADGPPALPSLSVPPVTAPTATDDDTFQRICMSWYQAGYYTALWNQKHPEANGDGTRKA